MIRRQSAVAILVIAGAFAAARAVAQQPSPDPRVGLRAGWMDAAQAAWNMRLVSTSAPPREFIPEQPGDFGYMNSDIAFQGHYVIQGSFRGFQVWDVSDPAHPTRTTLNICPDMQSDVSVYRHLLFVSGESTDGRIDCGTQGVQAPASPDRFRGIRIYDISDLAHPK
ncbi:MAG TPA: hypothetical protein VL563_09495, partial [Gemmatimonadales bacterium]|nr:hypothetical protein [Gemmatimonadales bacterium]